MPLCWAAVHDTDSIPNRRGTAVGFFDPGLCGGGRHVRGKKGVFVFIFVFQFHLFVVLGVFDRGHAVVAIWYSIILAPWAACVLYR